MRAVMSRGKIIWTIAGVLLVWAAAVGFWFEPESLTLTQLDVATPSWPQSIAPLRVVLLSDLHMDTMHVPPARVRSIAARVNAMHPDVVLLAGDYIGGDVFKGRKEFGARPMRSQKEIALDEEGLRTLGAFQAKYGVYAVMGNHDCWWDCDSVRKILAGTHVQFLENKAARIARPDGDVWILGIEDGQTEHPDFPGTQAQAPKGAAAIALTHNPGLFDWASNTVGIQMSGHSHAGQVRFPLIGAPITVCRHTNDTAKGGTVIGNRVLIVTRGVGSSGIPVRFNAPPQILLVTVHPGPAAKITAAPDIWLH